MGVTAKVTTKDDLTPMINKALKEMGDAVVYVGVPADSKPRKVEEGEKDPPTNAELAYWHNYGDARDRYPPRPVLEPGVEDAKDKILEILKAGSKSVLDGKSTINRVLGLVGTAAVSSVKNRITNSIDLPPLSPTTVAIRKLKATKKGNKKFSGERPLLDTAQLMNAFTYVVDKIKGKK
jgi:hypothetical protein